MHNQILLSPPDLRIGATDVGLGVFAARDYACDEEILIFHGPIIDFAATLIKGDRECDAFQIGIDRYLDLEPPGVYINHSCDPNAGIRDGLRLVAIRRIPAGEEIRYDYSTTMDEGQWEMECRCGAPSCRGLIRDFKRLDRGEKLRLLRLGIVPGFIIESERAGGRLTGGDLCGGRDPLVENAGAS
jgi:hypothetical protein